MGVSRPKTESEIMCAFKHEQVRVELVPFVKGLMVQLYSLIQSRDLLDWG